MKKLLRILFLTAALSAALCISAVAAEETDTTVQGAGFYNVGTVSGVKITPAASSGTVLRRYAEVDSAKTGFETFYAGSDKLQVEVADLTNGSQYLVMLVDGDGQTITQSSIRYIDLKMASDGKVTFDVFPMLPANGASAAQCSMTLIITGAGGYQRKNISLNYTTSGTFTKQPFKLGDVDDDSYWTANDALYALQIAVNKTTLWIDGANRTVTEAMRHAADTDGDTYVTANDALLILQKAVGKNVF